jgi:hypothetical protein
MQERLPGSLHFRLMLVAERMIWNLPYTKEIRTLYHLCIVTVAYTCTELRGRVVSTPASYSEGPVSNLDPESGYPDLGISWFSSVPPGKFRDSTLKLCHDRFLPRPFQFIIQL